MRIYYLQKGDLISAQNYFDRVIKFDPSMKDMVSEILGAHSK